MHCFQWNAEGSAPGGLIEGIADWVRLNAGLAAGHWKREARGEWDAGYQHTGFFLQWLEERFGAGTVGRVNACLRVGRWDEGRVFAECCGGMTVRRLWEEYRGEVGGGQQREAGDEEARTVPTDTPPRLEGEE